MNVEQIIFKTLKFTYTGKIEYVKKEGVYVKYENNKAIISDTTISFKTRGLSLLAKEILKGKKEFEIVEIPEFDERGLQIDLSRNGVMRVSAIKEYINYMACMGLNSLIMYMEDVYKIPNYPFFGYMRGAYSHDELKEIDEYGRALGIEVIPHIQVLGHMSQYFKWNASSDIRNNFDTFLCGEEKTYQFIEEMIKTMRECFTTDKIHIGCDEAPETASGKYLKKNGLCDTVDVINQHVKRVVEICKNYNFEAIMYSDLYFSLKSGMHYDPETKFPENFKENIPDVSLMYWDYGRTDEERYSKIISKHKEFGRKTIFAGGIWGWKDILPRYSYTIDTFIPALRACIKNNVKSVYATIWGDDGCECNKMYELFFAPIVSEYCFKGYNASIEDVYKMSEFLFGIKEEFFSAVSESAMPYEDTGLWGYSDTFYGKGLFYTDILYNLTNEVDFYKEAKGRYIKSKKTIEKTFKNPKWKDFEKFAVDYYDILIIKADVIVNIRTAYENSNKAYLKELADLILPDLKEKYINLMALWQKMWLEVFKPFGWECLNSRLATVIARIDYAIGTIDNYLSGNIETIEELDEPLLIAHTPENRIYAYLVTGSKYL